MVVLLLQVIAEDPVIRELLAAPGASGGRGGLGRPRGPGVPGGCGDPDGPGGHGDPGRQGALEVLMAPAVMAIQGVP